jgi:pyruvate formate lyase activating enzyme
VASALEENAGWIDGAVVSGGEPTIHSNLADLLGRLREMELPVKLDTNGTNPSLLKSLVREGLVQHVALDVKAPLEEDAYDRASCARGELARVRETLSFLEAGEVSCELRTTVVPGIADDEAKLLELARALAWAPAWYLQRFRPVGCLDPDFERAPATDEGWLGHAASRCREIAPGCRVRGRIQ